jgi:hypothetical protein
MHMLCTEVIFSIDDKLVLVVLRIIDSNLLADILHEF